MIMIPLPFLIAAISMVIFFREWTGKGESQRMHWFLWFLLVLAFQEILIGVRFGYGMDWLRQIQPITAATLPPLAYFSFARPPAKPGILLVAIPVALTLLLILLLPDFLDSFLAANNLVFAILLARLGMRGTDALGWVKIGHSRQVLTLLWLVCAVLIVSGITDLAISYDFLKTDGSNTSNIAGSASLAGILIAATISGLIFWRNRNAKSATHAAQNPEDAEIFARLEALVRKENLFLDADINLNRIARRMVLPVRDVSRAVNSQTGQNVSQYINMLRVKEACQLLKNSDMQVTQIIYAAGFNTKSNFNREFMRVEGMAPSEWRKGAQDQQ